MHPYAHSHLQRRARLLGFSIAILIAANSVSARYIGGEPPACGPCQEKGPYAEMGGASATEGNASEDFAIAGFGFAQGGAAPLVLAYDSYNADGSRAAVNTVMGFGWTHSYNVFLFSQRGHMFRFDGGGRVAKYQLGPGGTYAAAPGYFETLVKNPDGSFTLRKKDGTVYTFASVPGTPFQVGGPVYPLKSIADRNGNLATLAYSGGLLAQIADTYGKTVTLAYYANKKLKTVADPLGRVTTFHYNATGKQLSKIVDPLGRETKFSYNARNQLTKKTDRDGRVFTYQYSNGKPSGMKDGAAAAIYGLSNPNNWATDEAVLASSLLRVYKPSVATRTDGRGNPWRYEYDSRGYVTRVVAPDGAATTYAYDPVTLNLAQTTDANGHATTYEYDSLGNLTKVTDALGFATSYAYEPTFSKVTSMTDPKGRVTTYEYDANGNRTKETDPLLQIRTWTYDARGNVLSETDKRGNATTYAYDGAGNRISAIAPAPLGYLTTMTYDGVGNLLSRTDPNGHATSYIYDALNRVTAAADALGNVAQTAYDNEGNKIEFADRNGHVSTYQYDLRARAVAATDALGQTQSRAYDGNDNLIAQTDRNGHATAYEYDSRNRLIKTTDAEGNVSEIQYDPVGNALSATDANGHATVYEYDAVNRRIQVLDAEGYVTTYAYDTGGSGGGCSSCGATPGKPLVTEQIDGNGKVVYFKYDDLDRLTKIVRKEGDAADVIDASDALTVYGYDANGNRISATEPNGNAATYEYDELNRLSRHVNGAGDVTEYGYDGADNRISQTEPNGNVIEYTFDPLDRVARIEDSVGLVAEYTYDPVGNRLSETDGNGNSMDYGYDALDRIVVATDALGQPSFTQYDPVGNVTQATDREGNITTYTYDAINRRVSVIDALPAATHYEYDGVGNLARIVDANGHATIYEYDGLDRLIKEQFADAAPNARFFAHDAVNIVSRADQKGQTTQYVYNDLYFLLQRDYPVGPDDHFAYDLSGRMLSAERDGWIVAFAYDGANRIATATQDSETVGYIHDIPGRTRQITYPSGRVILESFDARDRLQSVDDGGAPPPIAQYSYDLGNRATSRVYRNGVVATYAYDANDRTSSIEHELGGSRVAGFGYEYDHEGNKRFEERRHAPARSEAYQYDSLYRLIDYKVGSLVGSTVPAPATQTAYSLDPLGNWNSVIRDAVPEARTHNAANEIVAIGAQALAHDANGNLASDGEYAYAYDEEDRLAQVTRLADSAIVGQYRYDALGRRVEKIANPAGAAVVTRYFHDGPRIIEEQDGGGAAMATYAYGNYIDETLSMDRAGQTYFYHANALWSVEALTDAAGVAVERYAYDAYGAPTVTDGAGAPVPPSPWGAARSAVGNPRLFSGHEFDEETGLYFFRARGYDARKGRFLQRDPIGYESGGLNLYEYAHSSPTFATDPLGYETPSPGKPQSEHVETEPDGQTRREGSFTRGDYEEFLTGKKGGKLEGDAEKAVDRGCVGLCSWRQGLGLAWPEDAPGVECWDTLEKALAKKCKEGETLFVFAKQGYGKGYAENKDKKPGYKGERPEVDDKGKVKNPKEAIELNRISWNYATLHKGYWEWMNHGIERPQDKASQRARVAPWLPDYAFTIYCSGCRDSVRCSDAPEKPAGWKAPAWSQ